MNTAPFVRPQDKGKARDAAEMSYSDFQPKRFALSYDPPMIGKLRIADDPLVLEYLVPSTGKLYHHKMKMMRLTPESDTEDMLDYLKKRHPLYFTTNKITPKQITDLINRLKFRLKQQQQSKPKPEEKKAEQPSKPIPSSSQPPLSSQPLPPLTSAPTQFKSGS